MSTHIPNGTISKYAVVIYSLVLISFVLPSLAKRWEIIDCIRILLGVSALILINYAYLKLYNTYISEKKDEKKG